MIAEEPRVSDVTIQISAPHFCAGLVARDGVCIEAAPIIRYSWGAGASGQNVAGSQDFSASYDTSISITTFGILGISKGVRANLKGSFVGRQITASLKIDLCNNAPSSSSCASQDPSVVTGTDLTGTRTHQPIHL